MSTKKAVIYGMLLGILVCGVVHYVVWSTGIFYNQKVAQNFKMLAAERDQYILMLSAYNIIEPPKDGNGMRLIANKGGQIVERISEEQWKARKQSEIQKIQGEQTKTPQLSPQTSPTPNAKLQNNQQPKAK